MDFTSAPKGLSEWLICGACAIWLASLVIDLFQKLRGKPGLPPNESLGNEVERLDEDLSEERRERAREDKEETKGRDDEDHVLHSRITELRSKVDEMRGEMKKK